MESFKSLKLWLLVVLVLSFLAVGLWPRPVPPPAVTVTSSSVSTSTRLSVATRTNRAITRVTKPDGTVIEKREESTAVSKEIETSNTAKNKSVTITPSVADKTRYRLGADWLPSVDRPPSARDSEVRAGARVGDSNVWIEGGYDFKHNQAKVGVSVEW